MASQRQVDYNKKTAAELGWSPSWFGEADFNDALIESIKAFQSSHGLTADGLCGPGTYRRVFTAREASLQEVEPCRPSIVYNGEFYPIKWDKVVHWFDKGGLGIIDGAYTSYAGKAKRPIKMFVNHWDVCLSSESCVKILNRRKVSVQFCIDNDGTIYQTMDMQHAAWHAGNRAVNHSSVGVEISDAYYPKYQSWYVSKGHGERPIVSGAEVHGEKLEDFLGFYPVQLEALAALWEAIHSCTDTPFELPKEDCVVSPDVASGKFAGFVNHYHVTNRKIDCAGMDNKEILQTAMKLS
tara:strand:- start:1114 stop:2001 length:888 start_codon:yes stop_codon:yes gene_type:complete